jgi:hypothetical protein
MCVGLAVLAAGCGQFKLPKATKPDDLPKLVQTLSSAPEFTARARDLTFFSSSELANKPAVVIGVDWRYTSEAEEWQAAIEHRFGKSGDRYRIVKLVEDGRIGVLSKLSLINESDVDYLASPNFAPNFGFANEDVQSEGPHVVVISADGKVLGTADGVARSKRLQTIAFALQGVIPPLAK